MADKKQTQVCDIRSSTGMSSGLSNEQLRNFSFVTYENKRSANFDPTREHLNFEIGRGGVVLEVNKRKSIQKRIKENLKARGIINPNEGKKNPVIRIVANIILQGSTDTMRRLAFGNQHVNWEHGSDNSSITRCAEIERWAQDQYRFIADKYGEENIAAFIVHLDESNPHIHCTLLPITPNNRFSWKQVFVGKDKFEYSARMKALHDELAEVNKKWGLERGDPVALTGAQHKSYNQYLQEQIAQKEEVSGQLDTTIASQQAEKKHLGKDVKKAQKRLKGLTTMYENLLLRKGMLEQQIELLNQQKEKGVIDVQTYQDRKALLDKECEEVCDKIALRRQQLRAANESLDEHLYKHAALDDEMKQLEQKMQVMLPDAARRVKQEHMTKIMEQGTASFQEKLKDFSQFRESLSYGQQQMFDHLFVGNEAIEHIINDTAETVADVASLLFLGYAEAALQTAVANGGGGGGTGSSSGWGRDKDDDDDLWWRKCLARARHMMKKSSGQSSNLKR